MNRRNHPFWLFIFSLITILIIRELFRDGMFMDGLIYASVSKNLANGIGTFWQPQFSQTLMPLYHEQPPLLFGIEALFFKILGGNMYTERVYGLLITVISFLLIIKLWNNIFEDRTEKEISWLPLFLLMCIPVYSWSYANNMEEPTMFVFDFSAILFIRKAVINRMRPYLNLSIAALMLIAASMCKGVQGLFPLVSIFFYWILFRNTTFKSVVKYTAFLSMFVFIFYVLILLNEQVFVSYKMYFNNRILTTFFNPASTHTNRFYIIGQLFSELLLVFIVVIAVWLFLRAKKMNFPVDRNLLKISFWFFIIGLSGTLPLIVTIEQSGYYLVTVLPYYAIGFAILLSSSLSSVIESINVSSKKYLRVKFGSLLFLIASALFTAITILFVSKRDQKMLHDVYLSGKVISQGSTISIAKSMSGEWSLHGYYSRYYGVSLDASEKYHKYFLLDKELDKKLIPADYKLLNLTTDKYDLYTIANAYE